MLAYDVMPGDADHAAARTVVLLHGRGADRTDLHGLQPMLPRHWTLVLPDAPHDARPWGYGDGRAWYRYLGGTEPEPASFDVSQKAVTDLLQELIAQGHAREAIVLGGFSQGGTTALGHTLLHPEAVSTVLNFSGFVPDHPAIRITPGRLDGVRVFWGHGTEDPAIPHDFAHVGRDRLRRAGARLETRDYPIGHWIAPQELSDAVQWVERGS